MASLDAIEHGVLRRSPAGDARAFGPGDLRRAKYGADFGAGEFAVLGALAKFVPGTPLAAAIVSAAVAPGCKVEYADYDWDRSDA
ncbi:hypothetical protein M885DRAFT_575745 [Pelagophyceae sp. CCMP2097]|nr:hypothetical protein M885DRAFT_575745 [Pelagophyceae sp. CCMP2097]